MFSIEGHRVIQSPHMSYWKSLTQPTVFITDVFRIHVISSCNASDQTRTRIRPLQTFTASFCVWHPNKMHTTAVWCWMNENNRCCLQSSLKNLCYCVSMMDASHFEAYFAEVGAEVMFFLFNLYCIRGGALTWLCSVQSPAAKLTIWNYLTSYCVRFGWYRHHIWTSRDTFNQRGALDVTVKDQQGHFNLTWLLLFCVLWFTFAFCGVKKKTTTHSTIDTWILNKGDELKLRSE